MDYYEAQHTRTSASDSILTASASPPKIIHNPSDSKHEHKHAPTGTPPVARISKAAAPAPAKALPPNLPLQATLPTTLLTPLQTKAPPSLPSTQRLYVASHPRQAYIHNRTNTSPASHTHVVVISLGAAEVRPRGLRRPQHVPVVPQQPAVEGVGHGARRVRADVGEGEVGVARAEQPVGEPPRGDEEPWLYYVFVV